VTHTLARGNATVNCAFNKKISRRHARRRRDSYVDEALAPQASIVPFGILALASAHEGASGSHASGLPCARVLLPSRGEWHNTGAPVMRPNRRRGLSPALTIAVIVGMAAIGWFLPHRRPRVAPSAAVPVSRQANTPALAERTDEVTLREYTGLCSSDDVTSCERACDRGDAASCRSLGWHYEHGTGRLQKDDVRAAALFARACDGGDAMGCANLGVMYDYGRGVEKDEAKAAASYARACEAGNAQACTNLGVLYDNGRGVGHDEARAAALYRRGCENGHAHGCANLAVMYEFALGGLDKDEGRATDLYRRGCDGGSAFGCTNLGRMYEYGRGGLSTFVPGAATLYQRGCDRGDAAGCTHLGRMYEGGLGDLPKDAVRARELYRQACTGGDRDGCAKVSR
jgi:TPR repeat protein